ncbi:MAG: excinuclease ABC subunit UvrC [Limnochordaceae bacterium]|nr:excinuclease ABC subunit UvrC [Limnochordaceae bacterium]
MVRLTRLTRHSRRETGEDLDGKHPGGGAPVGQAPATTAAPASAGLSLPEKLALLPARPGVYLMKNAAGEVIYVGKASSLRSRVRSYFQSSRTGNPRVDALVAEIADFEWIVTASAIEALVLESNLIKRYRPFYNVKLRDDKAYPYLKVTTDERYPRVLVVRRIKRDGARYFGPYTNSGAVRETMRFLRKLFPIRTCDLDLNGNRRYRLCLQYYIGRCLGPCAAKTTEQEYRQMIDQVCLFLEGRQERLIPGLEAKMREAAARLEFERAARLRDQIQALRKVVEHQKVVAAGEDDQDVVAFARFGETVCAQVFYVRGGKLIGRDHFILESSEKVSDTEVMSSFVQQFYERAPNVPPSVTLQHPVEEPELLERWLTERRGARVRLVVPQRGDRRRLVEMAAENAALVLEELRSQAGRRAAERERGLAVLRDVLALDRLPRRIEAFDISNIQGTDAVASMVVMEDGEPKKSDYRRFKIRLAGGPNDFAMMKEAVHRRFSRGLKEREELKALRQRLEAAESRAPATAASTQNGHAGGVLAPGERAAESPEELKARLEKAEAEARFAVFPDLLLIDGGKGQLNAAREALRDLGLDEEIPAIGLAKRLEQIFVEDEPDPIELPRDSYALHLLQQIRDEAHRFAVGYHRKLRGERATHSALDDIPGVGPRRKKQLIEHFGSAKRVMEATLEELLAVPGLPRSVAERIHQGARPEA